MKKSVLFLMTVIFVALLEGCTTPPAPRDIVTSFPMKHDFDTTWSAVIETFGELNIPIDNMEKDSGLITTDWLKAAKGTCDCGKTGLGVTIPPDQMMLNVFVKRLTSGECELRVNAVFRVEDANSLSGPKPCVSTGVWEESLYDRVSAAFDSVKE